MDTHDKVRSRERLHLDRQIEDYVHDPYHERYKPTEPAVCPVCGVVFEHARHATVFMTSFPRAF